MRGVNKVVQSVLALTLLVAGSSARGADYPLLSRPAPDFALRAFAGENVRLSEHRGEVVVLVFWSSRCGTCGAQLEALNRSFATYHSAGLEMYGISVDDDRRHASDFVAAYRVGFQMLYDPLKEVSRQYEVQRLPMVVMIDRSGIVRDAREDFGTRSRVPYLSELKSLLDE